MCLPVQPYKVEREWEHSGLKCAVVQAREGAHRCGYVRVPPGHPMHGKHYDAPEVDVHGGLTFAEEDPCSHEDGRGYWFGFDCAHAGDSMYEPGAPRRSTFSHLEFAMLGDDGLGEHYWTQPEVEAETERLAQQFAAMPAIAN